MCVIGLPLAIFILPLCSSILQHSFLNTVTKTGAATPPREVRPRPKKERQTMSSTNHSATFLRFAMVRTTRSKCPSVCWAAFTKNAIEETHTSRRRAFAPAKRLILNVPLSVKMSNKPFLHTLANWGRGLDQRCHNRIPPEMIPVCIVPKTVSGIRANTNLIHPNLETSPKRNNSRHCILKC